MKTVVVIFMMVILLLAIGYGQGYVGDAIMGSDSMTEVR